MTRDAHGDVGARPRGVAQNGNVNIAGRKRRQRASPSGLPLRARSGRRHAITRRAIDQRLGAGACRDHERRLVGAAELREHRCAPGVALVVGTLEIALVDGDIRGRAAGFRPGHHQPMMLDGDRLKCREPLRSMGIPEEHNRDLGLGIAEVTWGIRHRGRREVAPVAVDDRKVGARGGGRRGEGARRPHDRRRRGCGFSSAGPSVGRLIRTSCRRRAAAHLLVSSRG
ncbi:unannotated protein [freshwater metagenome]|uniref:Unannotated protein n=1 Tax=freshwater metagenome TaxID=449393 RepID=A0A6J7BQ17_9ZZZZ